MRPATASTSFGFRSKIRPANCGELHRFRDGAAGTLPGAPKIPRKLIHLGAERFELAEGLGSLQEASHVYQCGQEEAEPDAGLADGPVNAPRFRSKLVEFPACSASLDSRRAAWASSLDSKRTMRYSAAKSCGSWTKA